MKVTLEKITYATVIGACCVMMTIVLLRPPSPTLTIDPYKPGDAAGVIDTVDYSKAAKTVLIVLRSGYEFCSASMPFYRRLADAGRDRNDIRMLVVTRDDAAAASRYLGSYQLTLPVIPSVDVGRTLKIRATPTLILVDRNGVAKNMWVGQLTARREDQVIAALLKR